MFCKCVPLYIGKSEDNFSCSILLKKGLSCFYLVGHYLPSCHRSTGIKNALPHPLVKWLWESPQVSRLDWLILLLGGPSPWPRSVTCIQKLIAFFFFLLWNEYCRGQTKDLVLCMQVLYHWAVSLDPGLITFDFRTQLLSQNLVIDEFLIYLTSLERTLWAVGYTLATTQLPAFLQCIQYVFLLKKAKHKRENVDIFSDRNEYMKPLNLSAKDT